MAKFPLPVLRPDPDTTVVTTSQEELQIKEDADQARHEETIKEGQKTREASEKQAEKDRKEADKRSKLELQQQKKIFNESLRTGLLGKLEFAFKQRKDLQENTLNAIKDSLSGLVFGKTIADKEAEESGKVRTTIIERILTNEKYKEAPPEPKKAKDGESDEDQEGAPTPEETPPGGSPVVIPDGTNLTLEDVTISRDLDSEKNQLPVFKKINQTLTKIGSSLTKYFKDRKASEIEKSRQDKNKSLIEDVTKKDTFLEDGKSDGSKFSFPIIGGIRTLIATIGGVVMSAISGVVSLIVKAFPIAALATGLYMAVKDGISGWFSAEAWGVNKIAGFVGGLLGGLDSGVYGMLKNGGKWALVGAGIGSVVPVVGTLLGGLLGAGFGAILGWFGGEKIAKFIDGIINFVVDKWNAIVKSFWDVVAFFGRLKDTFVKLKDQLLNFSFDDIKKTFKDGIDNLYQAAKDWVKNLFTYDYWFGDEKIGDKQIRSIRTRDESGKVKTVQVEIERKPLEIDQDQKGAFEQMNKSFDALIEKMETPTAKAKEIAVERMVERTVENSVINNTNTNNSDYSRTNNTVVNNTTNRSSVNILGVPSVRNREDSVWGTQGAINGGRGNFGRY